METDNSTALADNSSAPVVDPAVNAGIIVDQAPVSAPDTSTVQPTGNWKSYLRTDLRDSPLSKKFEDNPDGLNKALESHANLEKLLGHEKIPVPKDANDVEGWSRFSKAMGIPDKPDGYKLADASIPDSMKDLTLDKNKFAEVMHANKVHPSAVKGIWETYQKMAQDSYKGAMDKHQKQLTETVNNLKNEWGDAYQANVELGQMVINKFSSDKEMNDYLTASFAQDPRAIKFLAKIGDQFAENKVGEFKAKRFSVTPDEAMEEVRKIKSDMNGPYMNQSGKFTDNEHDAAVAQVNSLIAASLRARG